MCPDEIVLTCVGVAAAVSALGTLPGAGAVRVNKDTPMDETL